MKTLCTELQSILHEQIPIARAMGVEIVEFVSGELVLRADLAANINVHGTAFAGSLYSICALSGWSMIWLQLRARELQGHIVIRQGQIEYLRPVSEDFECRCSVDQEAVGAMIAKLESANSIEIPLVCTVDSGGRRAVRFGAAYTIRLR